LKCGRLQGIQHEKSQPIIHYVPQVNEFKR
jgi:hypothetical protein